LVLIIGPSGVGKSVVLRELKARHPECVFPRSATTRARREGEGDDLYHFVTDQAFDVLVKDGKVLEWAVVHDGARYGTLEQEIVPPIEQGKIVIREVDIQGFHSIRGHPLFSGATARFPLQSIFILPESRTQLVERIRKRAPMRDEELARRLQSMDRELEDASLCSAQVVNREGKLEETVVEIERVIFGAS
jgi:guanylate kinase